MMIALCYNGIIQEKFTVSEFAGCQQARQQWGVKGSYRKYLRNHLAPLFCANVQLGKAREERWGSALFSTFCYKSLCSSFFSLPPSPALYSSLKQQRATGKVNRISCRTVPMKEFQVFDLTTVLWETVRECENSPPEQKRCSPNPVIG